MIVVVVIRGQRPHMVDVGIVKMPRRIVVAVMSIWMSLRTVGVPVTYGVTRMAI